MHPSETRIKTHREGLKSGQKQQTLHTLKFLGLCKEINYKSQEALGGPAIATKGHTALDVSWNM